MSAVIRELVERDREREQRAERRSAARCEALAERPVGRSAAVFPASRRGC